jgi:hypothetical protein
LKRRCRCFYHLDIVGLHVKGDAMLKFALAALGVLAASPAFAGLAPIISVPEPVSMSLLAIGVGGVAAARALRNRKK